MSSKVLKFIIFLKTIYSTNLSINYKYRVFVIYIPRYILYIRKIIWTLQAMCQYADDHQTTNLIVLKKLLVYNCYCKQILKWLTFVFKLICWSPYVSNYRKKKEICLSVASRPPDLLQWFRRSLEHELCYENSLRRIKLVFDSLPYRLYDLLLKCAVYVYNV